MAQLQNEQLRENWQSIFRSLYLHYPNVVRSDWFYLVFCSPLQPNRLVALLNENCLTFLVRNSWLDKTKLSHQVAPFNKSVKLLNFHFKSFRILIFASVQELAVEGKLILMIIIEYFYLVLSRILVFSFIPRLNRLMVLLNKNCYTFECNVQYPAEYKFPLWFKSRKSHKVPFVRFH